jgi:hypothetical protein
MKMLVVNEKTVTDYLTCKHRKTSIRFNFGSGEHDYETVCIDCSAVLDKWALPNSLFKLNKK